MGVRSILAVAAAATSCAFMANAWAYSDEAIADGETLLKTLQYRATFGEVTWQDLAIARFYLLELKLGAGKLAEPAFCAQAQAELRTMIGADGDEVTKAGLAGREAQVEAMNGSTGLCRQAVTAVDTFLFGPDGSRRKVEEAEKTLAETRQKFRTGDAEQVDVTRAEADLFEAQYASGKSTRAAYCASGQKDTLAHLTQLTEQLAQVGQAGLLERIAAKRRYWSFKALCPAP